MKRFNGEAAIQNILEAIESQQERRTRLSDNIEVNIEVIECSSWDTRNVMSLVIFVPGEVLATADLASNFP